VYLRAHLYSGDTRTWRAVGQIVLFTIKYKRDQVNEKQTDKALSKQWVTIIADKISAANLT
jgi:hypothetical protein